jgi:hypothetical protein
MPSEWHCGGDTTEQVRLGAGPTDDRRLHPASFTGGVRL